MENIYASRIESLRKIMFERGWDAVVFTGSDPHSSEYPAERWKQVQWLTGFTGEAGDVVITSDHAGLWTDTRYFIQAVQQLEGTGVQLHKTRIPEQVLIPEWLSREFAENDCEVVIAVDGKCVSADFVEEIKSALDGEGIPCSITNAPDLLDELWEGRPDIPQTPIFLVEPGEDADSKIARLREFCTEKSCDGILLSSLDDIAWTLNVRASDIEYNPLVISYLLITRDEAVWFVLKGEIEDPETEACFESLDFLRLERYDAICNVLREEFSGMRLFIDKSSVNQELWETLNGNQDLNGNQGLKGAQSIVCGPSPVSRWKAVKNPTEIEGMRRAMLLDGVAMEKFLYWLEKSLAADRTVTEWDAAVKLGQLRSEAEGYRGDSFETISAYGPGAALPHYITPRANAPVLRPEGLYLCDSGGQYEFGTTDITRTVPLGPCSELEREDYTLVLKGHIDLCTAVFPAGTPGCRIDALAREPLWKFRRNFGHGTGHGVGWFLGVHEGPQDIRQNLNAEPLRPGMINSDEPGIYREGLHGVRHENLILCVEDEVNEFGSWLRFEPLTLCHFDTSIIEWSLLNEDEIKWLRDYNSMVFSTLSPLLPEEVRDWLEKKCHSVVS